MIPGSSEAAAAADRSAFERLMAGWPELAFFAGRSSDRPGFARLGPETVGLRLEGLDAFARTLNSPFDQLVATVQARFYRWLWGLPTWRQNPAVLDDASALLLRQTLGASSDPRERPALEAWVSSLPKALTGALRERESPHSQLLAGALESARGFVDQLEGLRELISPVAVDSAVRAVGEHLRELSDLRPRATPVSWGAEGTEEAFGLRCLPCSPAILRAQLTGEERRLEALLEALPPSPSEEHAPGDALGRFQHWLIRAQSASVATGLFDQVAFPIDVMEVPRALRPSIPALAAFTPRPLAEGDHGLVVVNPQSELGARSDADLALLAAHEGAPGHMLNASVCASQERPWRGVDLCPIPGLGGGLFAAEVMEGWPHACEGLMAQARAEGWPTDGRAWAKAAHWRVVRAQVDLELCLGEEDEATAAGRFRGLGMSNEEALGEVAGLIANPTYGLSYALGRLMLEELPPAPVDEQRRRFRRILAEGLVPLAMILRRIEVGD